MNIRLPSPLKKAGGMLLLFAGLVALIGAATWPWPLHFATGLAWHWDPPFHAWKLNLVARSLLEGHLLPQHGNSNVFFPESLTLYYEALHWPQAVLAAALILLTGGGPILVYNLVYIAFWSISGCCLYLLLKELGMRTGTCVLGAALFCVLPYRLSYLVEFNMQLAFGLPLFLLFLVRFFRRPGVGNGIGLAVSFWLQASSELYQALILAMVFLVVAAAAGWEVIRKRLPSLRCLYLPVLAATIVEAWPDYPLFQAEEYPVESPVLEALDRRGPSVLAIAPMGFRWNDSRYMLGIGRTDRLLVYGWGGFVPRFSRWVAESLHVERGNPAKAAALLAELWPDGLLLVDRDHLQSRGLAYPSYEALLAPHFSRIAEDRRFALYEPAKPVRPARIYERITRADVLLANPTLTFTVKSDGLSPDPVPLWVDVNGSWLQTLSAGPAPQTFDLPVPPAYVADVQPSTIRIACAAGRSFQVDGFTLAPAASGGQAPAGGPTAPSGGLPPWLNHVTALPPEALPASIRFGNGMRLEGVWIDKSEVRPGDALIVRTYWRIPRRARVHAGVFVFLHFNGDPKIRFQDDREIVDSLDPAEMRCQPYEKLFVIERRIEVPPDCPPGACAAWIGLHDYVEARRIRGTSSLPSTHRREFALPLRVRVMSRPR